MKDKLLLSDGVRLNMIGHPGGPTNSDAGYDADPNALMGLGMEGRVSYYEKWRARIDEFYKNRSQIPCIPSTVAR